MTQERMPAPLTPKQRMKELIERLTYGKVFVLFTYTYRRDECGPIMDLLKKLPGAKYVAGDIVFKNGSRAVFMKHSCQKICAMRPDERYYILGGDIHWG